MSQFLANSLSDDGILTEQQFLKGP
jgi:hypothetical protein